MANDEDSDQAYEGGPVWEEDVEAARSKFEILFDLPDGNTHYVEAQAGTGSRYTVMATWLHPNVKDRQDSTVLITVLTPYHAVIPMNHYGTMLHLSWLRKKLQHAPTPLHGGDLMGVALCIGHVLEQDVR